MSEVLHINDADFETAVVQSDIPVLVDFWAPWCGPCKMIAPILDEIAPEFAGKAKIVKINVDDNQLVAGQFGVRLVNLVYVVSQLYYFSKMANLLQHKSVRYQKIN